MMLFVAILAMWTNDRFKRVNRVIYRKEIRALREKAKENARERNQIATAVGVNSNM